MGRRILFLGPPGAGKGTQAAMLARALGVPHISTGETILAHFLCVAGAASAVLDQLCRFRRFRRPRIFFFAIFAVSAVFASFAFSASFVTSCRPGG